MRMSLGNGIIKLAKGRPVAFRGARNVHLECTEGLVWLTLEGEPDDYFLAKGERVRVKGGGLALIEGYPSGAIRLAGAASWSVRRTIRLGGRVYAFALLLRLARVFASFKSASGDVLEQKIRKMSERLSGQIGRKAM